VVSGYFAANVAVACSKAHLCCCKNNHPQRLYLLAILAAAHPPTKIANFANLLVILLSYTHAESSNAVGNSAKNASLPPISSTVTDDKFDAYFSTSDITKVAAALSAFTLLQTASSTGPGTGDSWAHISKIIPRFSRRY